MKFLSNRCVEYPELWSRPILIFGGVWKNHLILEGRGRRGSILSLQRCVNTWFWRQMFVCKRSEEDDGDNTVICIVNHVDVLYGVVTEQPRVRQLITLKLCRFFVEPRWNCDRAEARNNTEMPPELKARNRYTLKHPSFLSTPAFLRIRNGFMEARCTTKEKQENYLVLCRDEAWNESPSLNLILSIPQPFKVQSPLSEKCRSISDAPFRFQ